MAQNLYSVFPLACFRNFMEFLTVLILILPTIQRWVQMSIKSLVDFVWRTNELAWGLPNQLILHWLKLEEQKLPGFTIEGATTAYKELEKVTIVWMIGEIMTTWIIAAGMMTAWMKNKMEE